MHVFASSIFKIKAELLCLWMGQGALRVLSRLQLWQHVLKKGKNRAGFMKATPYLLKKWPVLTKLVRTPHAKNAGNQLVAKRHTRTLCSHNTHQAIFSTGTGTTASVAYWWWGWLNETKRKKKKKNHNFSFITSIPWPKILNQQRRAPIRRQSY